MCIRDSHHTQNSDNHNRHDQKNHNHNRNPHRNRHHYNTHKMCIRDSIKETGDYSILDESTPYDSDPSKATDFMEDVYKRQVFIILYC